MSDKAILIAIEALLAIRDETKSRFYYQKTADKALKAILAQKEPVQKTPKCPECNSENFDITELCFDCGRRVGSVQNRNDK